MKNPQVGSSEKRRIAKAVARLLGDLRGVEPPINLNEVRELLELDREYYSSNDPGMLREAFHSIKVAGKEYASRNGMLGRLVGKLGLRAMLFWDQNRILIDRELHQAKHRWAEGHEIGHKLLSWHKHYLLGDSSNELSQGCHAVIEAEANYATGQLLFLQDRFIDEAMAHPVSIASVKLLQKQFGNSNASTLWRMVEEYAGDKAVLGIVSDHPHRLPDGFDHSAPCRYVIESPKFRAQFSNTNEQQLFRILTEVCGTMTGGPLGNAGVVLADNNGERHEFDFESFCFRFKQPGGDNGYQVLTLAVHKRRMSRAIVA